VLEPEASEFKGGADEYDREGGAVGVMFVGIGSALLTRTRSSIHRYIAPDTPSSTLNRSSMASLVTLSIKASCSSVKAGGSWDIGVLGRGCDTRGVEGWGCGLWPPVDGIC